MCWSILISPGSKCPEKILPGKRRDVLEDHVRIMLQLEGKVKERQAAQSRLETRCGNRNGLCVGGHFTPRVQDGIGMGLSLGYLCSSQMNAEVRHQ